MEVISEGGKVWDLGEKVSGGEAISEVEPWGSDQYELMNSMKAREI